MRKDDRPEVGSILSNDLGRSPINFHHTPCRLSAHPSTAIFNRSIVITSDNLAISQKLHLPSFQRRRLSGLQAGPQDTQKRTPGKLAAQLMIWHSHQRLKI
jgi:hypothetical protein